MSLAGGVMILVITVIRALVAATSVTSTLKKSVGGMSMALSESSHPTAKRAVAKIPNSQVGQFFIVYKISWMRQGNDLFGKMVKKRPYILLETACLPHPAVELSSRLEPVPCYTCRVVRL